MSTSKDLRQADPPNVEDRSFDALTSFWRSRIFSQSATPAKAAAPDLRYDFISFLGVAQRLRIDFLPITWQPALDKVGEGGTADIRQALINLQVSFAFKRLKWPRQVGSDESRSFLALIYEVSILGHPSIRNHPNIIKLEGICWDISPHDEKVWPVLVFEKTQNGDLERFMNSDAGKSLCLGERLKLCSDIATAVKDMHSCHIIHGDIKPQNVLVFKVDSGSYTAKLADFGYSTAVADDGLINMPKSKHWNAPEHHHRGFKFTEAMKMDAYSFGILCLWLIFYNSKEYPDRNFFDGLESDDKLPALALANQLITTSPMLDDEWQSNLDQFFNLILVHNPEDRNFDFEQLLHLLGPDRIMPCVTEPVEGKVPSFHEDFQIALSIYQLCQVDYRVRSYIARCLKQRASDHIGKPCCKICSQKAAFQLAFCYKIGFGVTKDDKESQKFLNQSIRQPEELGYQIGLLEQEVLNLSFRDGNFKKWFDQGYIRGIDFNQYYREHQQLERIELEYRREIADTESMLGDTHFITLRLKSTLSSILQNQGLWKEAEELDVQLMETSQRIHGQEHLDTLTSMVGLGSTYNSQGQWSKAEKLFVQAIDIFKKVLGQEHLDTLTSMAYLASTYRNQGRWKEAEELEVQVVEARECMLGQEHPDTLISMGNLASTYINQGRWKEAEELQVKELEICSKVLGQEHPDTLTSTANLASTYWSQGRWKEAEELQVKELEICSRVLGKDHPSTLTSMGNLASTCRNQGRWKEAEELDVQIVETRKRVFGQEHPDTLTSLNNLSATYKHQGLWNKAEELDVQVVETTKRMFGQEHPSTLTSTGNLASTYRNQGRWGEAEELDIQITETRRRVYGQEHPDTLTSINNLSVTYKHQGRWKEAEELDVQVVETRKRVLGQEHRDTLTSIGNLASTYGNQQRWKEAEELEIQVMEAFKTLLGQEHPDTLTSIGNLASTYRNQGRWKEAGELQVKELEICSKVLGQEHPNTLTAMASLASTYRNQGRLNEAEELKVQVMEILKRMLGQEYLSTEKYE